MQVRFVFLQVRLVLELMSSWNFTEFTNLELAFLLFAIIKIAVDEFSDAEIWNCIAKALNNVSAFHSLYSSVLVDEKMSFDEV